MGFLLQRWYYIPSCSALVFTCCAKWITSAVGFFSCFRNKPFIRCVAPYHDYLTEPHFVSHSPWFFLSFSSVTFLVVSFPSATPLLLLFPQSGPSHFISILCTSMLLFFYFTVYCPVVLCPSVCPSTRCSLAQRISSLRRCSLKYPGTSQLSSLYIGNHLK